MKLYDQHLHSRHSFDSQADPAANVERAIERGLAGLTFTEHFDAHPDDWETCVYDDDAYTETIRGLRDRFGERIFIGKGIEICFQPDRMAFILEFLERRRFDMVMLSVHYFGNKPVHVRDNWAGLTAEQGTRRYLETVLDAARTCQRLHERHGRVFDVLGHLDFVKRYTQRFFGRVDMDAHAALVDDILQACIAADITPEVNTSTLRGEPGEPMPGPATIKRYAALGGGAMSIGSDAHRSNDVGAGLDEAVETLKASGITQLAVFDGRKRRLVPLG